MGTTSHSEDSYPTSSQPAHLPNSPMQTSSRSLKQPQPNRTAFPFSSHFRNPHKWISRIIAKHRPSREERPDPLPTSPSQRFFSLLRVLPPGEVSDQDVLLDVSSDTDQLVLQAPLQYPFRRIIGVEPHSRFHRANPGGVPSDRARMRCASIAYARCDVFDFEVPDDVNVVFLPNTFSGELFDHFLQRLLDSVNRSPRWVRLVYPDPAEEPRLLVTGRAQLVRESSFDSTRMYLVSPEPQPAAANLPF